MSLGIPTPPYVGAQKEGGLPRPLSAFCDNCGRPTGVRSLIAVCVQPKQSADPRWLLLCGACYVDGEALP